MTSCRVADDLEFVRSDIDVLIVSSTVDKMQHRKFPNELLLDLEQT